MIVTKLTIVIVLNGIIIAATKGNKFPVTAKDNPTTLYNNESVKLILIVVIAFLDSFTPAFASYTFLNTPSSAAMSKRAPKKRPAKKSAAPAAKPATRGRRG